MAPSARLLAHYQSTWLGQDYPLADGPDVPVGYQAPPLDGIWATAPYLHNGSVPTLDLLLDSPRRPKRFTRPPSTDLAHYDPVRVGWKFNEVAEPTASTVPPQQARYIYDTTKAALGNGGHTFGDMLDEDERMAVIEYLKTL